MEEPRKSPIQKEFLATFTGFVLVLLVIVYFGYRTFAKNSADSIALNDDTNTPQITLPTMPIEEAKKRFAENKGDVRFLDIRTKEEFASAHLPQSQLADPNTLTSLAKDNSVTTFIIVWGINAKPVADAAYNILHGGKHPFVFLDGGLEAWIGAGGTIITYGDPTFFTDQSKVTMLSAEEFKPYVDEQFIPSYIIDVRRAQEYNNQHIPGAINIPLSELENRYTSIPPAKNIIVYGGSDMESFQAAVRLFDLNFFSVRALKGGFDEWLKKLYPTTKT